MRCVCTHQGKRCATLGTSSLLLQLSVFSSRTHTLSPLDATDKVVLTSGGANQSTHASCVGISVCGILVAGSLFLSFLVDPVTQLHPRPLRTCFCSLMQGFVRQLGELYDADKVKDGVFGAMMDVFLVNDGPGVCAVCTVALQRWSTNTGCIDSPSKVP